MQVPSLASNQTLKVKDQNTTLDRAHFSPQTKAEVCLSSPAKGVSTENNHKLESFPKDMLPSFPHGPRLRWLASRARKTQEELRKCI